MAARRPAQERPPMPEPMTMQSTTSSASVATLSREDMRAWLAAGGAKDSADWQRDRRAAITIDRGTMMINMM